MVEAVFRRRPLSIRKKGPVGPILKAPIGPSNPDYEYWTFNGITIARIKLTLHIDHGAFKLFRQNETTAGKCAVCPMTEHFQDR
jgi:hypothetical protein